MNLQPALEDKDRFDTALGERLMAEGRIDRAGLERARRLAGESDERLPAVLAKLGLVSERDLAQAMAAELGLPLAAAAQFPDEPLYRERLSPRFLREALVLPLAESDEGVTVAMADPLNGYAADALRLISGRRLLPCVATPAEIEAAVDRLYADRGAAGGAVEEAEGEDSLRSISTSNACAIWRARRRSSAWSTN